ncbi:MAG: endonuclease NucS domain-containing protein [Myxococcota bacterium]
MPHEVKLWQIDEADELVECTAQHLDSEERLEKWIETTPAVLANGLLIIGRQVETEFGGWIDLLALDANADLVVIELKRDKTPREVVAQALDYASWVKELSHDDVCDIADRGLGDEQSLEDAFSETFGEDLPETLNGSHRILIVASRIDASSERIMRYLSEHHGVDINAVTFQFFKDGRGSELLGRVFLMDPGESEESPRRKGRRRSRTRPTLEQSQELANERGVGDTYRILVQGLGRIFPPRRSMTGVQFKVPDASRKAGARVIVSVSLAHSSAETGVFFRSYSKAFGLAFGPSDDECLQELLPPETKPMAASDPEYEGFTSYLRDAEEARKFVDELARRLPTDPDR